MNTLNQLSYFGPRTPAGVVNLGGTNTRTLWGSASIGAATGFVGP